MLELDEENMSFGSALHAVSQSVSSGVTALLYNRSSSIVPLNEEPLMPLRRTGSVVNGEPAGLFVTICNGVCSAPYTYMRIPFAEPDPSYVARI